MNAALSDEQQSFFADRGYLLVEGLLDAQETALLRGAALADKALDDHAFSMADGEGGQVRLALWNHPGDSIYGMIARSRRVVEKMEALLGGEVYHYHSKMIMKDARVGGAWAWHQDYGYWYHNGVLAPDLASVSIAVDPSTRENGCLQIVPGSHKLGRLDHVLSGDQAGADLARVHHVLERMPVLHVELNPGDAIFFHCNMLHRSDANTSQQPRWSMICCYNSARNDPYMDSHHPRYTPLVKVDDTAIVAAGLQRLHDDERVAWMDVADDISTKKLSEKGHAS